MHRSASFLAIVMLSSLTLAQTPSESAKAAQPATPPPIDAAQLQKLLDQLHSKEVTKRMAALHQIVGKDRSLPILKNVKVRAALIDLLNRETQAATTSNIDESVDFEYYDDFITQAVQKIAQDYGNPEAWKAIVYSGYAPGSPFGKWIAQQPEAYPLLLAKVDATKFGDRVQSLTMLGEIRAATKILCPKILPLLRQKANSPDYWTQQGAMLGLGLCGSEEDIVWLQKLPACSTQWDIKILCKQMENKIAKRLDGGSGAKPATKASP